MTRGRLAGGAAALAAGLLFFGDYALPGPRREPPPARPSQPLARVLAGLPGRNTGRFGKPGDPLNLVFVGSEDQVRGALSEAGWANIPVGIPASLRSALGEVLRGRMFRTAPPMNLYELGGRTQDLNWSKPITPISKRHHFRLWRTAWRDEREREVWWGAGNYDLAVRWWDLSHVPDPDNNAERDFIAASLEGSRWIESAALEAAPQVPREGANDKGYPFRTDGRVLVVALKGPRPEDRRSEAEPRQ